MPQCDDARMQGCARLLGELQGRLNENANSRAAEDARNHARLESLEGKVDKIANAVAVWSGGRRFALWLCGVLIGFAGLWTGATWHRGP